MSCKPPAASGASYVNELAKKFRRRTPLRAGSAIVTLFGDCIVPRGGVVWLGSLIELLEPLGISERLVRTAVYRLVQDQILHNELLGRRSFYSLTETGRRQFSEASSRIYAIRPVTWDGQWRLLILSQLNSTQRSRVRKDLKWLGFGAIGNELLAHPNPDRSAVEAHLRALDCGDRVISMDGNLPSPATQSGILNLVRESWNLPALEAGYREFVELFQPCLAQLESGTPLPPRDAFYLRTFLIHEYRKLLLRDPGLPGELLPPSWQGHTAQQLAASIYQRIAGASETFINHNVQRQGGPLPAADDSFRQRFRA